MRTRTVLIIEPCVIKGSPAGVGEKLEVSEIDAATLVSMGRARALADVETVKTPEGKGPAAKREKAGK